MPTHTLADIARLLDVPTPAGAEQLTIGGVAPLDEARAGDLSVLSNEKYRPAFDATAASAVIVDKRVPLPPETQKALLIVPDADAALSRVLTLFAADIPRPPAGIDPSARVAADAVIASDVRIGPNVCIGSQARIAAGCILHAGVYIGDGTVLGEGCTLHANVVVRERIRMGNRVIIHAGAVIGSDGFGYRWDGKQHAKIPQIGIVIIEDDVEIGSCTCIDRAKIGATRIGRGTKIDNLVQIGHNVQIGQHCILCGQVGIAGSAVLGNGVILGGQVAVRDHVTLGDGCSAAACSGIAEDIPPKTTVYGTPAVPMRRWMSEYRSQKRLPELFDQVKELQARLAAIEGKTGG